ncbi:class I SAM-dependent methyltransferase [Paractinoplanes atraurantiacus]|nr:class I SAM-dependent methyltransferase [Actinoplanes atraurantiacus]
MHDFARDALLAVLPRDMSGARVVDLGCGEGLMTRAVAARGATVVGIDPTERLVEHARSIEAADPCGATYAVDDGTTLATVSDSSAEWVTAGLSLNNVPDLEAALRSVRRVLAPGGRLAFTVPHPCFEAPHAGWADSGDGTSRRIVGDYFAQGFWRSANPSGVRRAGNQHRTLSRYLMALIAERFAIEVIAEPQPDQRLIDHQPHRAGLPPFLVVRGRRCGGPAR